MKKFLSLALALAMVLGLGVTAFATPTDPLVPDHTLTITNSDNENHTYEAYQIITGTLADLNGTTTIGTPAWGANIHVDANNIPDTLVDGKNLLQALREAYPNTDKVKTLGTTPEESTPAKFVAALGELLNEGPALATLINKYLTGSPVGTSTKGTTAGGVTPYTIDNLASGYYMVKDQSGSLTDPTYYTNFMLQIVEDTTAAAKSDVPEVTKKIRDVTPTDAANIVSTYHKTDANGDKQYYVVDRNGKVVVDSTGAKTVTTAATTHFDADNTVTPALQASDQNNVPIMFATHSSGPDTEIELLDNNTKSVSETVNYEIRQKLPNMDTYTRFIFQAQDTLSQGLTFNNDETVKIVDPAGKVVIDLTKKAAGVTATTTYELDPATQANGANKIDFTLNDFIQYRDIVKVTAPSGAVTYRLAQEFEYPAGSGTMVSELERLAAVGPGGSWTDANGNVIEHGYKDCEVLISYSAQVNEKAVIGNPGNPNTVKVQYSRDPSYVPSGDKPTPQDVTGITPDSTVKTYVTDLELLKKDENDKELTGATFQITGTSAIPVKTTKEHFIHWVDAGLLSTGGGTPTGLNAAGIKEPGTTGGPDRYYRLVDNTYTLEAPKATTYQNYTLDTNEPPAAVPMAAWNPTSPPAGTSGAWADPANPTDAEIASAAADLPKYYYTVTETVDIPTAPASAATTQTVPVDANGHLYLGGIGAGEYVIHETIAPNGYNLLLEDLYLKIVFDETDQTFHAYVKSAAPGAHVPGDGSWDAHNADYTAKNSDGWYAIDDTNHTNANATGLVNGKGPLTMNKNGAPVTLTEFFSTNVKNQKGSTLPETGGIGTTIFYIVGTIMVLGAAVVLVTRKRMGVER